MLEPITAFRGQWAKFSNYSPCIVFYQGHAYPSVEHAYQAQKTLNVVDQRIIRHMASAADAKAYARKVELRPDWETAKLGIMAELLSEKFAQEPERTVLLSTGLRDLVEGNWWHDTFWGQCPLGNGQNWLGKLLMGVRAELRNGRLAPPSETWQPL